MIDKSAPGLSAYACPMQPPSLDADTALPLMATPLSALMSQPPIALAPQASIRQAAELMCERRASSVLVVQGERLFGLVTDRDLRNRVLATGMDSARPLVDVTTLAPWTLQQDRPAIEALLLMARHRVHHVPVMDGERVVGMVTSTDLTERHGHSAVHLAGDIHQQTDVPGLVRACSQIGRLQQSLAAADASAYSTGHIVTAMADALTERLLQLAEVALGPAPVDYAWVAAGSQARHEQTARSDQDNCLVLDDRFDAPSHGAYFQALAQFVCDGLNACGYVYCPGEMMAMTGEWRQTRAVWRNYFDRWTTQPEPKALMLTCVFFDQRAVAGRRELLDSLRADVLSRTQGNRIFLAHMVGNALTHRPPVSLWGGIRTERQGPQRGTLDLKHGAIVPVVDLARVYALAGGDMAVNTHDRLENAAASGEISEQSARDLRDALEYVSTLRIQHQARRMAAGQPADNHLSLSELSQFERRHLRDAFAVVQTLQDVLAQRWRF